MLKKEVVHDAQVILDKIESENSDLEKLEELSKESPKIAKILKKYDTNKDGIVDELELKSLKEHIEILKDVREIMHNYDKNDDGVLDEQEVAVMVKDYMENDPKSQALKRWDTNTDGTLDPEELRILVTDIKTTSTPLRLTGYTFILPSIFSQGLRYTAYTSDLGESFRPIVPPRLVTLSYSISWMYVLGDVTWEGYKAARLHQESVGKVARTVSERAIFQSFASMVFPAFIIHTQVKIFKKIFQRMGRFVRWGPTVAGLATVPLLPYILDKPVEYVVEWGFHKFWPAKWGGVTEITLPTESGKKNKTES